MAELNIDVLYPAGEQRVSDPVHILGHAGGIHRI